MHYIYNFSAENKFLTLAAELAHFPIEIPAHFRMVGNTVFEVQDSIDHTVRYKFNVKWRVFLKMLYDRKISRKITTNLKNSFSCDIVDSRRSRV